MLGKALSIAVLGSTFVGSNGSKAQETASLVSSLLQNAMLVNLDGTSNVLDSMKSMQDVLLGEEESITPAARNIIQSVADKIPEVQQLVLDGHTSTQSEIDKLVENLKRVFHEKQAAMVAANAADKSWIDSVVSERNTLELAEAKRVELSSKKADTKVECDKVDAEENKKLSVQEPEDSVLNMKCVLDNTCTAHHEQWLIRVQNYLKKVDSDVDGQVKAWNGLNIACSATKAALQIILAREVELNNQFTEKRKVSKDLYAAREGAMCNVWEAVKNSDSSKSEMEDFETKAKSVTGHTHSVIDRRKEWTAASTVRCLIQDYLDGVKPTATSLETCQKAIKYEVLELNFRITEMRWYFDKVDTHITWSGITWLVPQENKKHVTSSDYTRISPHHMLDEGEEKCSDVTPAPTLAPEDPCPDDGSMPDWMWCRCTAKIPDWCATSSEGRSRCGKQCARVLAAAAAAAASR